MDRFRKMLGIVPLGGWRRTSGTVLEGKRTSRSARDIAHKAARRWLKREMQEEADAEGRHGF